MRSGQVCGTNAGGSQADNNLGGIELGELSDRSGFKPKSYHCVYVTMCELHGIHAGRYAALALDITLMTATTLLVCICMFLLMMCCTVCKSKRTHKPQSFDFANADS